MDNEIKHDGFRMMAQRRGVGGRLLTRNGNEERAMRIAAIVLACPAVDGVADRDLSGHDRLRPLQQPV